MKSFYLNPLQSRGRIPQSLKKIKPIEAMELKLKDRVSGKTNSIKYNTCGTQVLSLIGCLTQNNMAQSYCQQEVDSLYSCYKSYLQQKNQLKDAQTKGVLIPNETKFTHKQINKLLRRFPLQ